MGLDHIRSEIEHMRLQVARQRKEILQLQRAGIPTPSAEALLQRMLDKIDGLCSERNWLKHFQDDPNPPPFIKALAEVRHLATREGWCYVQAIAVAIDQYAAKVATANTSSRIGEAVSCAASYETCADIPGLPRNKRFLHDTTF